VLNERNEWEVLSTTERIDPVIELQEKIWKLERKYALAVDERNGLADLHNTVKRELVELQSSYQKLSTESRVKDQVIENLTIKLTEAQAKTKKK
jgi:hypothetical protein